MSQVVSVDGTSIAYDQSGKGPAVILVDGALCYRAFGPMGPLAALLAPHFTFINYDRRGRGESGNTLPYSLGREIEDLEALISKAGGSAFVFGTSSGTRLRSVRCTSPRITPLQTLGQHGKNIGRSSISYWPPTAVAMPPRCL